MAIVPRCARCAAPLAVLDGERYCPDCNSFALPDDPIRCYVRVKLPRPFEYAGLTIDAIEYSVGAQTDSATVLHVRGRCDGDVPFAGCLVISEGRDAPTHDLRTFGEPRDTDALAAAVEACLAERTTVPQDEMRRISAQDSLPDQAN
jgi:hypothetical protein